MNTLAVCADVTDVRPIAHVVSQDDRVTASFANWKISLDCISFFPARGQVRQINEIRASFKKCTYINDDL